MGCLYASLLSKNNDVTLLDVSETAVKAINGKGITMTSADSKEKKTYKVKATFSGELEEAPELLIVFVKDTATKAALK